MCQTSLQDSDGDGWGDLVGLNARLPYISRLGAGAVWITPIYPSPMADFGYDVSDYLTIHPLLGDMTDFRVMLDTAHSLGLAVILDFVPNHSSSEHEWFQRSERREWPYSQYYVWADPLGWDSSGSPVPPSNWLSKAAAAAVWAPAAVSARSRLTVTAPRCAGLRGNGVSSVVSSTTTSTSPPSPTSTTATPWWSGRWRECWTTGSTSGWTE